MKLTALLILILSSNLESRGQLTKGDLAIYGVIQYINFEKLPEYYAAGVGVEIMMGKRIGAELGISGGKDYVEVKPGLFIIEQVNYHIPVSKRLELIPYFSYFRIRNMYEQNNPIVSSEPFYSWSVGVKLSIIRNNNWLMNLAVERSQLYYPGRPSGIESEISFGRIFSLIKK
jgi:hypothetical protein